STSGVIASGPRVDFAIGGSGHNVALSDMDGDGKLDVVVTTEGSGHLSLFRNISTAGALTSGSLGPRLDFDSSGNVLGLAVGDLDGDGRPDVLGDNSYGLAVSMYRNVVPQNAGPPPPPSSSP